MINATAEPDLYYNNRFLFATHVDGETMCFLATVNEFNLRGQRWDIGDHGQLILSQTDLPSGLPTFMMVLAACLLIGLLVCYWTLQRHVTPAQRDRGDQQTSMDWTDLSENRRKLLLYSIAIMSLVTLGVLTLAEVMLYLTSFEQQRNRLVEMASAQARLIEAVARFDRQHDGRTTDDALAATISQIVDAHQHQSGLGQTGEFTMARRLDGQMVFLLQRRHGTAQQTMRIPFQGTALAEPMRQALSGKSGTTIGPDYRGESVLAAYEPVGEIDFGIVAKIDLDEIREPFRRAAWQDWGWPPC